MEVGLFSKLRQHRILLPNLLTKGTEVSRLINVVTGIGGPISYYLEIGVEYGKTLEAIRANKKIGVDPKFLFHSGFQTSNLSLYKMTSDEYFSLENSEKIDIAFIDDWHSATQAYIDFINLLSRVNEKSIIIIDDTIPSDIYSTLSTPEEAYLSRNNAGVPNDFKWHGDIYRCIYSLIANFPSLNYATIVDMKNPVTIFYGFSEESSSIKSRKLATPNNYENFLSSLNIAIPNEFNLKVKEEFYYDLKNYYANI